MSQGASGSGGLSSGGSSTMYHVVPAGTGPSTTFVSRRRRPPSRQPRMRVALAALAVVLLAVATALWVMYAASVRAARERAIGRLVLSARGVTLRGTGDSKPVLRVVFGRQQAEATLGTLSSDCVHGSKHRSPDDGAEDKGDGSDRADDGSYSYDDDDGQLDDGECVSGENADAKVSVKKIDVGTTAAGNVGDASRSPAECYGITWTASRPGVVLEDCVVLDDALWYGGAQLRVQRWPLEFPGVAREPVAYIPEDIHSVRDCFGSVMERYWLSSRGAYIFVADDVPLYVGWATMPAGGGSVGNGTGVEKALCMRALYGADEPYRAPSDASRAFLHYELCVAGDVRAAHALASARHLGAPSAPPDERMVRCPVWSTWALHKRHITQAKVVELAEAVVSHGFNHSHLQIDDGYEAAARYGDYNFDRRTFPDPAAMVRDLRTRLGFRLTLWVHPFVNYDANTFRTGVAKGLFVQTAASNARDAGSLTPALVRWRRGIAAVLDVTNPAAVDTFVNRTLHARLGGAATGFDSFQFDGGEVSYLPRSCSHTHAGLANPAWFSSRYAALASHFGPLAEVRVAFRAHGLAAFVRAADRASAWSHELGLRSLIPTALTFGLLGYPYVLPDVIGGNAYGAGEAAPSFSAWEEAPEEGEREKDSGGVKKPERELYIRWLELGVFMPAVQFSVPPWLYDEEVVTIARKFTALREEVVAPVVMEVARAAVRAGAAAAASSSNDSDDVGGRGTGSSEASSFSPPTPMIVRPLWWAAPRDRVALRIDSQFLLGDAMLVAPVLEPNARARDVYLPAGTWCARMGGGGVNGGRCHPGQKWLRNFKVALDEVAYFVRKS